MKKQFTVLIAAAMGVSLAACGTSPNSSGQSNPAKDSPTRLSVAKTTDLITMNSAYAMDGTSFDMIVATIEGLETMDKDGNVIPALAESYTLSDDELTYTFKLRDANWDNGEPVTADDFVFAWNMTVKDPAAEYAYLYTQDGASIKNADAIVYDDQKDLNLGVKAVDDKTLEVQLSKKCPYFVSLMTFPVFYPINQKFYEEQNGQYALSPQNLLANGPFKMVSWVQGSSVAMDKNPTYWDADKVAIDGIDFNIVPDISTSVLDFENGNTDFTKLSSTLIDKYKDSDAFTSYLEGYMWFLEFNLNNKYLSNANLRKAIATVVDRADLTENVLKDGSVPMGGFVPSNFASGPDGKDYTDTAKKFYSAVGEDALNAAKEYWDKARKELGVDSITLTLLYDSADPAISAAEYIQSQIQKLPGVTIEMVSQEKKNRVEKQKEGDFDIVLTRWGPDYADPTTYLNLMLSGNAYNYGGYSNAQYDKLMQEAADASTPQERWEKLHQAEEVLMEDTPVAGLFQVGGASLVNPKVTGIEPHSVGMPYIYKNVKKAS